MDCSFKKKFSFSKRTSESKRILSKYNDKIPIIITRGLNCDLPDIDKNKFLVPFDLTVGQFLTVIRKRIKLPSNESIFLFIDDKILPSTGEIISIIYNK
mgnify:CR=1 FL=1